MEITFNAEKIEGFDSREAWNYYDKAIKLAAGVPEHFRAASVWDGIRQTRAVEHLDKFIKSGKTFACLLGAPGSGKTFPAVAFLTASVMPEIRWGSLQGRCPAAIITAYDMAEAINRREWDRLDALKRADALLIDDLGTEPAGWRGADFLAHFENLINYRYERKRRTILTANITAAQFLENYGERTASRLADAGMTFEIAAPDYRRESLEALPVYQMSIPTRAEMAERWRKAFPAAAQFNNHWISEYLGESHPQVSGLSAESWPVDEVQERMKRDDYLRNYAF